MGNFQYFENKNASNKMTEYPTSSMAMFILRIHFVRSNFIYLLNSVFFYDWNITIANFKNHDLS